MFDDSYENLVFHTHIKTNESTYVTEAWIINHFISKKQQIHQKYITCTTILVGGTVFDVFPLFNDNMLKGLNAE